VSAAELVVDAPAEHRQRRRVGRVQDDQLMLTESLHRRCRIACDRHGHSGPLERLYDLIGRLASDGQQQNPRCHQEIPPDVRGVILPSAICPSLAMPR